MASGRILINSIRCKGCGLCLDACPPGVLAIDDTLNPAGYKPAILIDPQKLCTGCALCAYVCPDAAITVFRTIPEKKQRMARMEASYHG